MVHILSIWLRSNIVVDSHTCPFLTLNMLPKVMIKLAPLPVFQAEINPMKKCPYGTPPALALTTFQFCPKGEDDKLLLLDDWGRRGRCCSQFGPLSGRTEGRKRMRGGLVLAGCREEEEESARKRESGGLRGTHDWAIRLISCSGGNFEYFIDNQFIDRFPCCTLLTNRCCKIKLSKFPPLPEIKPIVHACYQRSCRLLNELQQQ